MATEKRRQNSGSLTRDTSLLMELVMVRLVSVAGDSGSRPGKDTWLRFDCCMLLFEDMLDIGLRGRSACSCLRWMFE